MSAYEVWHRVTPTFRTDTRADVLALDSFPEGFVHVADVDAPNVGAVFGLTNTIDYGWWENPEVVVSPAVAKAGGARSTSVGDVIVEAYPIGAYERGKPMHRRWSIEPVGLKEF
jgi:hypothetical protein